jgi:hypothetical protein
MRMSTTSEAGDCPQAPGSRHSTYARALHRACMIVGGLPRFAAQSGLGEAELCRWMAGEGEPPEWLFLMAVEIILLDLDAPARGH